MICFSNSGVGAFGTFSGTPFAYSVVGVSFGAMGFLCVAGRRPLASQKVFSLCHGFKVFRIHARPIAAQMVELQAFRNWADKCFVHLAMSETGLAFWPRKFSVAILHNLTSP